MFLVIYEPSRAATFDSRVSTLAINSFNASTAIGITPVSLTALERDTAASSSYITLSSLSKKMIPCSVSTKSGSIVSTSCATNPYFVLSSNFVESSFHLNVLPVNPFIFVSGLVMVAISFLSLWSEILLLLDPWKLPLVSILNL